MTGRWWIPTRKWLAARITALTGVLTMWASTGSWDAEETVAALTFVSAAAVAWLTRNDKTDVQ